ncbi:MAG: T9SS type A sorting domain-containing protein [Bacteroidaceae bacterium]|nr:T9SS type A sorting domain-containing protein [Bacteroidaceae bacterium]
MGDKKNKNPNPVAKGEALHVVAEKGAILQLVNLQGILLKQQVVTENTTALSMDALTSGTYLLVVKTNTEVQVRKILVN